MLSHNPLKDDRGNESAIEIQHNMRRVEASSSMRRSRMCVDLLGRIFSKQAGRLYSCVAGYGSFSLTLLLSNLSAGFSSS